MQNRSCIEITLNKKTNSKVILSNSSSDNDDADDDANKNHRNKVNQDLIEIQRNTSKAIEEQIQNNDPLIYDYDEAYDDICREREKKRNKLNDQSREPKYMKALIESSQRSKLETIMMKEKVIKKKLKRENGGNDDGDVPVFVTKKYKEALDELNKRNAIEENEEKNTINNKEFGMMGFYAHLLTRNKLYSNNKVDEDESKIDHEIEKASHKDISAIYDKRKKEYERHIPQINPELIKKNTSKPIERETDNEAEKNNGPNLLDKKEEYLLRYLQRKTNRERKDE